MNPKIILITGATDGIGLETAIMLGARGHHLLLHGRNPKKLDAVKRMLTDRAPDAKLETCQADFSSLIEVEKMADEVGARHPHLDVLINNAGILKSDQPRTTDGLDIRFAVNTIAPWLLTQRLLPLMDNTGRVLNLSSAAQQPVDLEQLVDTGEAIDTRAAYAQSKLAITMWSVQLARKLDGQGPVVLAINPGSLLATKMVKESYDETWGDASKGAEILVRAALDDNFAKASGRYFDNDAGNFAPLHPHALDRERCNALVQTIEKIVNERLA